LAGFEPVIFWSGGGRDDHYATQPGQTGLNLIILRIFAPKNVEKLAILT
jgi:hypothetical protein